MSYINNTNSTDSYARFFHAVPGAAAVDIYANDMLVAQNLSFANITKYQSIPAGKYTVNIYKAGDKRTPLATDTLNVLPNGTFTVSAILLESTIQVLTLKDTIPNTNKKISFVRFLNFSPDAPLLTLSLPNGNTLFNGVEYLETTGYYPLDAGIYDFLLESTNDTANKKYIRQIKLDNDQSHTIFIIGLVDGTPKLGSYIVLDGVQNQ